MKKIIGILGVAVLGMSMFFNANFLNTSGEGLNLENLVSINTANAETTAWLCTYTGNWNDRCSFIGTPVLRCTFGSTSCGF